MRSKLSLFYLSIGIFFFIFSGFLVWQRYYNPSRLSFSGSPPKSTISKLSSLPDQIIIPDLKLDLPVFPALIENGVWQTTSRGVSYLMTSTRPGEIGNSIFYGHNWPRILGNLKNIKPGQRIVIGSNKSYKSFWVSRVDIIKPTEVNILSPGKNAQLTLYTCYGFADTQRLVVTAYTQEPK